ncbi:unnamed protein product [Bursaphelenchus xylophilus]|uniref:(pine wood nematode) hypothetical protein n=1 Tax=Bursaphelenchus xylophilus TaxID=6326 RepID=A0A7I8WRI4_BURXY|nr:unnamed protein product [Bursaphelenchus xylophilus]CAG9114518.1 unnamed protein product [Bursaphelenchus xylophilus]
MPTISAPGGLEPPRPPSAKSFVRGTFSTRLFGDASLGLSRLYKQSLDQFEKRDQERNEKLDAKAETLSVAGRELESEIRAIYDNLDLTDKQTCEAVAEAVFMSATVLQKELGISPPPCEDVFKNLHKH